MVIGGKPAINIKCIQKFFVNEIKANGKKTSHAYYDLLTYANTLKPDQTLVKSASDPVIRCLIFCRIISPSFSEMELSFRMKQTTV